MRDSATLLAANLAAVRARIQRACERAGRSPHSVTLVAVTKYARREWVAGLAELGVCELGESRPQQLIERAAGLAASTAGHEIRWHLIGHLQRNKVRPVLRHAGLIHSVDSLRLARRVDQIAGELALSPAILLETNVSGEASKDGFAPDQLIADWPRLSGLGNLHITGLMTMAPANADPEASRPGFQRLRQLRQHLCEMTSNVPALPHLSMGMSGDFEIAIEEGATLIRIGSALFEGLE